MYGNFSPDAIEAFTKAVGEENFSEMLFDFTRCERPDGSVYGTSGRCRKGTDAGPKEDDMAHAVKLRKAVGMAGPAQRAVAQRMVDAAVRKRGRAGAGGDEAKSQVSLVTPQKRGGADLDRLNKYIKEEAVKFDNQRQAIREGKAKADDPDVKKNLALRTRNVNEAIKQRDQLQEEMNKGAASQSPKRPADNSPAAQQRRVDAALRGKD